MDALFLLIPLSLVALGVAAWLFLRMSSDGQFDEGEAPAYRVLMDDDAAAAKNEPSDHP